MSTVRSEAYDSRKFMSEIKTGIEELIRQLEGNTLYPPIPKVFTDANPSLKTAALNGHLEIESKFLSGLNFRMMEDRQKDVARALAETFSWIFHEDLEDMDSKTFSHWLQQMEGIYWIAGKAGCGKSTLMKFIAKDRRTWSGLQQWAGTDELVVASYFFWAAGTDLQKNQEGLLRALLHSVLGKQRDLIARLFPKRYEAILHE